MPTQETASPNGELGARAQAAEAGAWGAATGVGEAVRCVTRAGGKEHSRRAGGPLRGPGQVSGRRGVDHRDVDAPIAVQALARDDIRFSLGGQLVYAEKLHRNSHDRASKSRERSTMDWSSGVTVTFAFWGSNILERTSGVC